MANPRLPLTNAPCSVQHCGASCALAPSDTKLTSRYPDIIISAFEREEPILMKEGLSSGFESQHSNISEYLKSDIFNTTDSVCILADIVSGHAAFSGLSSLLPLSRSFGRSHGSTPA